jgi:putative transposase
LEYLGTHTYIERLSLLIYTPRMARKARVVAVDMPHHVTQRGNRRQQVFFCDEDYEAYKLLLAECCENAGVKVWAYCLMPNHVHLVLVPTTQNGLRDALKATHRQYTRHINFREGWRGYLWQGRFSSFPMDEKYLLACARYVEMNPVRARLVTKPEQWRWSSARAHLGLAADGLVDINALESFVPDWQAFLAEACSHEEYEEIRAGERTGRPLGSSSFIKKLEEHLGRPLARQKPGRKLKSEAA